MTCFTGKTESPSEEGKQIILLHIMCGYQCVDKSDTPREVI